ncbi:DUF6586 family protein [Marinobacterium sp. xm-d-564]|uniref:DUF6586 family protein n=1 Tax=Marinobacterium sp. xm-d-564 TaxID=2497742 RepID=UPI0015688473|nr:DUF6586 family protein [Marinobacterium sp. xm-d-564]NRP59100.1 hypothetical protein [Marinobacterium sp. xm-d-564]
MADLYSQRVNQTLAFAQYALVGINTELTGESNNRMKLRGLQEAALFHLDSALKAYLNELAERERVLLTQSTPSELSKAFKQQGIHSSELDEMELLCQDSSSWLSKLISAIKAIHKPLPPSQESASQSDIAIIDLAKEQSLEEQLETQLQGWFEQLRAMILRHRSNAQEW